MLEAVQVQRFAALEAVQVQQFDFLFEPLESRHQQVTKEIHDKLKFDL